MLKFASRSVLSSALVLLVVALVATGCQTTPAASPAAAPSAAASSSTAKDKLLVGYGAENSTQMPAWIAKEEGIFDKNNLNVELQFVASGQNSTAALLSGEMQILVTSQQAMEATLGGADLVYVAAPTSTMFFSLYAVPSITDAAGLKGKKVGITATGSATDIAARIALASLNLDADKDVTLLNISNAANIFTAMKSGGVDAGILSSPTNITARNAGMRELVNVAKLNKPFPSGWVATSKGYVASHEDVMRRYVKSVAEAVAFEIKNPEESQRVLAKYVHIDDPAVAKESYEEVLPYLNKVPTPSVDAVKNALELSTLPNAKTANPATFIDDRFSKELDTSGFINSLYQ